MLNTFLLVVVLSVEIYHLSLTLTEGRRHSKPSDEETGASAPKETEGPAAGKESENSEKPAERPAPGSIDEGIEAIMTYHVGLRERKEETP